jgi:hypothetical protein
MENYKNSIGEDGEHCSLVVGRHTGQRMASEHFLSFIDTLEMKEVDLESEQRMRECPYRQVVCTMYEGKILECKGACSWVVDYPKLKELKTQKGE